MFLYRRYTCLPWVVGVVCGLERDDGCVEVDFEKVLKSSGGGLYT